MTRLAAARIIPRMRNLLLILLCLCAGGAAGQGTAPSLELLVLGSGGPGAAGRAASSYLVLIDGAPRIIVDAGPGSFVRLGEAHVSLAAADIVLLTHLHIDHVGELPGLFKARAVSGAGPVRFRVYGPAGSVGGGENARFPGTREFLNLLFGGRGAFAYLKDFAAPVSIDGHDVSKDALLPQQILQERDLSITAVAGHHGDAPAVIYRIEHAGKSITFSGDIDPKGLPALMKIARATDLLVFNSVVLDPPDSPAILYTLHTPPHAIGELARDDAVHAVLLSHLSPAIEQMNQTVSTSIRRSYPGPLTFAKDGMRIRP